jgi:release factor glutamine methyltransferase
MKSANTLRHALFQAQANDIDRLDAQMLLLHTLGRSPHDRAWLMAHDTDAISPVVLTAFQRACDRRAGGEPLAYITGYQAFFGLDLAVDTRVLIPRPDTETLVEWALELLEQWHLPAHEPAPAPTPAPATPRAVLDLGTGSGAIALAIKATRPDVHVAALDYSTDALAVARANAERLHLAVQFSQGSWLKNVCGQFDLIVSNPPYIADGDEHLSALRHEPAQALSSGAQGLDDIGQIVTQAPAHLRPGGWLLLEHGYNQAPAVRSLLSGAGFVSVASRCDIAGIERCSGGQWPHQPQSIHTAD